MQWNRIKNLFILVFLLLNIYLIYQYNQKIDQADVPVLEPHESTLEHQLELEDIEIDFDELPDSDLKETYISVNQRIFTEEEFAKINTMKGQKMMLVNKSFIVSIFEKPLAVHSNDSQKNIDKLFKDKIPFDEEYKYWEWNKEANVIIYFQEKKDRTVYFNQNGVILIFLNDNDEAVFYTQTMLGETEQRQDEKSLIEPMQAVETLYKINELKSGDKITNVNIGFHTRVPLADGEQIFVPTWKVHVNNNRSYFVNAIEGHVFAGDEKGFLKESIGLYIDRIEAIADDKEVMKKFVLEQLNVKLDTIIGGE